MLAKQRAQIDTIDQQLIQLLEARLKVVEEVAMIKEQNQLPIFDESREKKVLAQLALKVDNVAYANEIKEIFQTLLKVSKEHQAVIIKKGKTL